MFAKLIAVLAENRYLIDLVTGNTVFWLSAGVLVAAGGWVLLMRSKHQKM